jgi:hypothetical protein
MVGAAADAIAFVVPARDAVPATGRPVTAHRRVARCASGWRERPAARRRMTSSISSRPSARSPTFRESPYGSKTQQSLRQMDVSTPLEYATAGANEALPASDATRTTAAYQFYRQDTPRASSRMSESIPSCPLPTEWNNRENLPPRSNLKSVYGVSGPVGRSPCPRRSRLRNTQHASSDQGNSTRDG